MESTNVEENMKENEHGSSEKDEDTAKTYPDESENQGGTIRCKR